MTTQGEKVNLVDKARIGVKKDAVLNVFGK